jgi:hypothetical protein
MHRSPMKGRRGPPDRGDAPSRHPQADFELKLRPSGRWGVFRDGIYIGSTGTPDRRLAGIRLRMYAQADL